MNSSIGQFPLPSTSNSSKHLDFTETAKIGIRRKSKEQQRNEAQIMFNPTNDDLKEYATHPNERKPFDITRPIPIDSKTFKLQYPAKSTYARKNNNNLTINKPNSKPDPRSKPNRKQQQQPSIYKIYRENQRIENNQLVFRTAFLENENQVLKLKMDKLQREMAFHSCCGQNHENMPRQFHQHQQQQQQPMVQEQEEEGQQKDPVRYKMVLILPKEFVVVNKK